MAIIMNDAGNSMTFQELENIEDYVDWESYIDNDELVFIEAVDTIHKHLGGSSAKNFLSNFFIGYPTFHSSFSLVVFRIDEKDAESENKLFQFPHEEYSSINGIRGILVTLSQCIEDVTNSEISCSVLNIHSERHLIFYQKESNLLLCAIIKGEGINELKTKTLFQNYVNLLKAKFLTLEKAYLSESDWVILFSQVFMVQVLNAEQRNTSLITSFSFSDTAMVPFHNLLTEFESGELQCEECNQNFTCIGSAAYYKDTMLVNHLPEEYLAVCHNFISLVGIQHLLDSSIIRRLVIWCPFDFTHNFLTVCLDSLVLIGVFTPIKGNAKLQPDAEIIDQAVELLKRIYNNFPDLKLALLSEPHQLNNESSSTEYSGWLQGTVLSACQHVESSTVEDWHSLSDRFQQLEKHNIPVKEIGICKNTWITSSKISDEPQFLEFGVSSYL